MDSTVKLIGWLRPSGLTLAMLAAALLMAPLLHCTLLDADDHSSTVARHVHAAVTPIPAAVVSALDYHSDVSTDATHRHGVPHAVHCAITPALPAGGGSIAPPQLLLLMLAAVVVLAIVGRAGSAGVRGPPVAAVPVVSGRVLLTRFCIARR
ncbi:hypothetical protein K8O92_23435 [Nocardia asteroides]|nr:hypothetical protein K8O92_23435 [Nocardia asteroides]